MKTAMQELIEYLEVRDRKFTYTYRKAIELLEKEKEQMIDFGYKCRESKDILPQDIFNSTYNLNK